MQLAFLVDFHIHGVQSQQMEWDRIGENKLGGEPGVQERKLSALCGGTSGNSPRDPEPHLGFKVVTELLLVFLRPTTRAAPTLSVTGICWLLPLPANYLKALTSEMAQRLEALLHQPGNLSPKSWTHINVDGENWLYHDVPWPSPVHHSTCLQLPTTRACMLMHTCMCNTLTGRVKIFKSRHWESCFLLHNSAEASRSYNTAS